MGWKEHKRGEGWERRFPEQRGEKKKRRQWNLYPCSCHLHWAPGWFFFPREEEGAEPWKLLLSPGSQGGLSQRNPCSSSISWPCAPNFPSTCSRCGFGWRRAKKEIKIKYKITPPHPPNHCLPQQGATLARARRILEVGGYIQKIPGFLQGKQNQGSASQRDSFLWAEGWDKFGVFWPIFEGKVGFGSIWWSCSLAAILGLLEKGRAHQRGNSIVIPFKFQGFCSKKGEDLMVGREDGTSRGCSSTPSPLSSHKYAFFWHQKEQIWGFVAISGVSNT